MKQKYAVFFLIAFIFFIFVLTYFNVGLNYSVTISALFIIIFFVILFELKNIDSKKMAVISTMATMGGIFRVPLACIPGVQPTTFLVAVSGFVLGPIEGFVVGATSAFISNFFLGHGPWTLWQMLGWGLCGVFFGLLKKIIREYNFALFTIFCGVWGYVYGIILNMWFIIEFIRPITVYSFFISISGSFIFDTMHAVGNVIFSLLFSKKFVFILDRFIKRFEVEYIE
ncbi:energy-coupling factor transport system substrate-specific component [Caloramator fervidus]|uniref:Energy-coupling factor transport system substrate-specific component n=1 Tax=Caloramator fervidus TaxID=29344 RepID=A0A1H5SJE2_9CLOT|nr:ECF transporter S component [Caloramator fervidus]SEF50560.1 energy-coupling factor transport system substrate-specific component [Caloramator fervidus]